MSFRKRSNDFGSSVSRRQEITYKRQSQHTIRDTVCRLNSQQNLYLRDMERMTEKIREEEASLRTNLSNMSTYYENNDFKKLTTNITDEERARQFYTALLERHPPTIGKKCLHFRSCPVYPCQPLRSYHFMVRNVSDVTQVQNVKLRAPSDDLTVGTKTCTSKNNTTENKSTKKQPFSRGRHTKEFPSNNVNMTKKEVFLRCAVLRRRLQDSDREYVVNAVNYGKKLPWRALKKPAMVEQTYGIEVGGQRRLLAF